MRHNMHADNTDVDNAYSSSYPIATHSPSIAKPVTHGAEKINPAGDDGENHQNEWNAPQHNPSDPLPAAEPPHDLAIATVFNLTNKINGAPLEFQLFTNYFGNSILKPGISINLGPKIAQGGYGNIYDGSVGNLNLIIKQVRADKGEKGVRGIEKELSASTTLYDIVAQRLNQKNSEYALLLGISTLVPAIGTATDGSLIQIKVPGKNLKDIVANKIAPYESGYPHCLREAIERLWLFFLGLAVLHEFKLVHCDIKPENVMLEDDPQEGYPCRIIDLGGIKTMGDKIGIHSSNGAPEYTEQTYAIRENRSQQEQLKKERDEIQKQIQQSSSPAEIEQLNAKIQSLKEQYDALAKLIASEESLRHNIAYASYDIYSATAVFLTTLFGQKGRRLANKLYYFRQNKPIKFLFLQMARDPNFNARDYFREKLTELNRTMWAETDQSYSPSILKQFIRLLTGMSSLNPLERPSAVDIAEALRNMALALSMEQLKQLDYIPEDSFSDIQW